MPAPDRVVLGDPIPGDPEPGDPEPGDPEPVDSVPVDPVAVDPLFVDRAPGCAVPVDPTPECLVAECRTEADVLAPVTLCTWHLAVSADWASAGEGVTDVLPTPCRLCGSRLGVRWPSGWLCAVCDWRHAEPVDGELPPPRVDVVYYLRFDDRVKIGTTASPRRRLSAIWHDELLAFELGDRLVERRRHALFAAERYGRTEWFRRSSALDAHVAELAAGVDDPWALHARWISAAIARRG